MDIAALSANMAQANLGQAVGIKVLKMAKDTAVQQNQDMVRALQLSVQPHKGQNLDVKV
jgi:hypothetical protein